MGTLRLGDWVLDEDGARGQIACPVGPEDFTALVTFDGEARYVRLAGLALDEHELPEPPRYETARIRKARKWHRCDNEHQGAVAHQIRPGQEYVHVKAFPGHPDIDCSRPVELKLCLLHATQYDTTHPSRLKEAS